MVNGCNVEFEESKKFFISSVGYPLISYGFIWVKHCESNLSVFSLVLVTTFFWGIQCTVLMKVGDLC